MANPLRHLTGDAAYLADFLRSISGQIVLVGHSYCGAVIANAATGNQQVRPPRWRRASAGSEIAA